jgi:hypothetical protein
VNRGVIEFDPDRYERARRPSLVALYWALVREYTPDPHAGRLERSVARFISAELDLDSNTYRFALALDFQRDRPRILPRVVDEGHVDELDVEFRFRTWDIPDLNGLADRLLYESARAGLWEQERDWLSSLADQIVGRIDEPREP